MLHSEFLGSTPPVAFPEPAAILFPTAPTLLFLVPSPLCVVAPTLGTSRAQVHPSKPFFFSGAGAHASTSQLKQRRCLLAVNHGLNIARPNSEVQLCKFCYRCNIRQVITSDVGDSAWVILLKVRWYTGLSGWMIAMAQSLHIWLLFLLYNSYLLYELVSLE